MNTLNATLSFGHMEMVLMTEQIVSLPHEQPQTPLGSLVAQRGEVIRAIDRLLGGV